MSVTIPLILLVGVGVYVAFRYSGLRAWQAVLCLLAGFLLAATTAAPEISQAIAGLVRWLGGSHP